MQYEMKDSGVDWIGKVPEHWQLTDIGSLYTQRNERVSDKDYEPLSVTKKGILPQLSTVAKTDDGDNRKLVKSGDFVINSRSDRRGSCGISLCDGSVSLINTVLSPRGKMYPGYFDWLFHTEAFADEFYKWGHGIVDDLWTTRWTEMKQITIPIPEFMTQTEIAVYLDEKCSAIDEIIEEAKASIEEYKAWKSSVIFEAVTKGLNPNTEMKDSGVEWIGKVPKHWDVCKLKYLCSMQAGKNIPSELIQDNGEYPVYGGNGLRGYYSNFNMEQDCILVGRQGALCGNVHIVSGKYWATEHAVITQVTNVENLQHLYYLLKGMNLNQYASDAAAQPGLAVGAVKDLYVPLTPKAEQKSIVAYLDEKCSTIDGIIAEKEALIADMEAYKKSLIFETVTGKRKVC